MTIQLIFLFIFKTTLIAAWSSSFTSSNGLNTRAAEGTMSMKIFDWKKRADTATAELLNDVENTEFTFDNLHPAPGSRKRRTRKGRGIAAGQGASCGFGMRGQRSRSGPGVRAGFEGGQQPLYRRLPKFVGRPTGPGHTKTLYNVIKLEELNGVAAGETVNFASLLEAKAITKSKLQIHKIVGGKGDFTAKDITVQAHAFTKAAKAAIEAAGGKCELLKRTTGEVIAA
jgi:large subunit ribosomal protein L15|eukprot:scaffold1340_cov277-Chaetoceros_neogracile.AAC.6